MTSEHFERHDVIQFFGRKHDGSVFESLRFLEHLVVVVRLHAVVRQFVLDAFHPQVQNRFLLVWVLLLAYLRLHVDAFITYLLGFPLLVYDVSQQVRPNIQLVHSFVFLCVLFLFIFTLFFYFFLNILPFKPHVWSCILFH